MHNKIDDNTSLQPVKQRHSADSTFELAVADMRISLSDIYNLQPGPGVLACLTTSILNSTGTPASHLPQALAIVIAINSCRTGVPIPVIIRENENGQASSLLASCIEMVDPGLTEILDDRKQKLSDPRDLVGKTIICYGIDRLAKVKAALLKLYRTGLNHNETNFVVLSNDPAAEFAKLSGDPNHSAACG
jgi:hypothetical protein